MNGESSFTKGARALAVAAALSATAAEAQTVVITPAQPRAVRCTAEGSRPMVQLRPETRNARNIIMALQAARSVAEGAGAPELRWDRFLRSLEPNCRPSDVTAAIETLVGTTHSYLIPDLVEARAYLIIRASRGHRRDG